MTLVHVLLALVMFSMDIIQQCNFGALDVVLGGLVSHDEGNAKIAHAGALHSCVCASTELRDHPCLVVRHVMFLISLCSCLGTHVLPLLSP